MSNVPDFPTPIRRNGRLFGSAASLKPTSERSFGLLAVFPFRTTTLRSLRSRSLFRPIKSPKSLALIAALLAGASPGAT